MITEAMREMAKRAGQAWARDRKLEGRRGLGGSYTASDFEEGGDCIGATLRERSALARIATEASRAEWVRLATAKG